MTDASRQIKIVQQALSAAQASLNLGQQILADLSGQPSELKKDQTPRTPFLKINPADLPGVVGTFDGENMVTAAGEKYPVPANYASKTLLVYGDKLKMIEPPPGRPQAVSGGKFFKQVDRVAREKVKGVLAQSGSDSLWQVVTDGGKHKVLEAAVKFHNLKVGDGVWVLLPLDKKKAPFAALAGPEKKPLDEKPSSTAEKIVAQTEAEKKVPVAVKPAPVEEIIKRPAAKPSLEKIQSSRRPLAKPAAGPSTADSPPAALEAQPLRAGPPSPAVKNPVLPDDDDLR